MKIVSWNSCGKFREKFKFIAEFDPDICVIQECENPREVSCKAYKDFARNSIWIGQNKNRGLGIFAKQDITLKNNNWNSYCLRHFLSVRVNSKFDLLAVWACKPYIEEYFTYQSIHKDKFNKNTIIIGDFNSNSIWDSNHDKRNHSAVVSQLKEIGLVSAYHIENEEKQGKETQNTFFLYRHPDKSYHIDYAFVDKDRIKSFEIPKSDIWLKYSDHKPIILELKI